MSGAREKISSARRFIRMTSPVAEITTTPSTIDDPDARDFDEVWIFDNPDGDTTERWFHAFGCRRWLTVRRDTARDVVLEVR